jgi:hypothetical protein
VRLHTLLPEVNSRNNRSSAEINMTPKYIEVECVLVSPNGKCGFKVRLHTDDNGVSGKKLISHLQNSHRIWLANIQPIELTNIYSNSPLFVVRETNDEEMQKWVQKAA